MGEPKVVTLSVITAQVGGFVGHVSSHPEVLDTAKERLYAARTKGIITDYHVLRCGDDLELILSHGHGTESPLVNELVNNILGACSETARALKLHEAAFSGGDRAGSPGISEMRFSERLSEPVVILMANRVSKGAWNLPLYRIFADPFNTPGLTEDPAMSEGFSFRVVDAVEGGDTTLSTPADSYSLLALIGSTDRFIVTGVYRNADREEAACVSCPRPEAGRAWGPSNPSLTIRCEDGFPAVDEAMEAFAFPHLVEGRTRGAHIGPLMPVPFYEANPTRFDGPPRMISAGFQVSNGRLIGPHDMFDDPSYDEARRVAGRATEYLRRHGPFKPHLTKHATTEDPHAHTVIDRIMERFKKTV